MSLYFGWFPWDDLHQTTHLQFFGDSSTSSDVLLDRVSNLLRIKALLWFWVSHNSSQNLRSIFWNPFGSIKLSANCLLEASLWRHVIFPLWWRHSVSFHCCCWIVFFYVLDPLLRDKSFDFWHVITNLLLSGVLRKLPSATPLPQVMLLQFTRPPGLDHTSESTQKWDCIHPMSWLGPHLRNRIVLTHLPGLDDLAVYRVDCWSLLDRENTTGSHVFLPSCICTGNHHQWKISWGTRSFTWSLQTSPAPAMTLRWPCDDLLLNDLGWRINTAVPLSCKIIFFWWHLLLLLIAVSKLIGGMLLNWKDNEATLSYI